MAKDDKFIISVEWTANEKGAKKVKDQLKSLGKESKGVGKKIAKSVGKDATASVVKLGKTTEAVSKNMGMNLTLLAWHFRFLGSTLGRVAKQWRKMATDWIQTAADIEEAMFGVKVAATLFGQNVGQSTTLVQKLIKTGMIEFRDAAESVRNLLLTGLSLPEVTKLMWGLLNVSTIYTVAGKDLGESITKLTMSIARGRAVLAKDLLITSLWADAKAGAVDALAAEWTSLTRLEKAHIIYNQVLKRTARTGELWTAEASLMAGQIYSLQTNIQLFKAALGEALRPVLDLVAELAAAATERIRGLTERFGGAISVVTVLGIAFLTLSSSIAFTVGVFISFHKIMLGLRAQMLAMNAASKLASILNWKMYLIITAVAAAIVGLTYIYLKVTGRLDKMKNSIVNVNGALSEAAKRFTDLGGAQAALSDLAGDSISSDEDAAIAHRRKVEDLEEDLDREVSKGLWANQMTIRDLQKRLRRENEDWDSSIKTKEKMAGSAVSTQLTLAEKLQQISDQTLDHLEKTQSSFLSHLADSFRETLATIGRAFGVDRLLAKLIILREKLTGILTGILLFKDQFDEWNSFLIDEVKKMFIGIGTAIKNADAWLEGLKEELKILPMRGLNLLKSGWIKIKEAIGSALNKLILFKGELTTGEIIKAYPGSLWDTLKSIMGSVGSAVIKPMVEGTLPPMQTGGIVPGPVNQPIPILAHGGEEVIPVGRSSSPITINVNNPIVRSDEDIKRIAEEINKILSQRSRWSKLGAF